MTIKLTDEMSTTLPQAIHDEMVERDEYSSIHARRLPYSPASVK